MDSLIPYLAADITLLVIAFTYLLATSAFWHPLTAYLFFHSYSFTWRAVDLIYGATPMYGENARQEMIMPEEFERAMMLADVCLICFFIGAVFAQKFFSSKGRQIITRTRASPHIINVISAWCIPLGFAVLFATKSGIEVSSTLAESNYFTVINMWPISCLLALLFVKGFRPLVLFAIFIYLTLVGLQGYHRFMMILPLIYMAAIYLQQKERKWPTPAVAIIGLSILLIFPKLKGIGKAATSNDYEEVASLVKRAFFIPTRGDSLNKEGLTSEQFLDQYAGALSMIDSYGKFYWGSTYLAVLTLPIPRQWWAEKPGLADHTLAISTGSRRYDAEGRIITYIGESYINFRYFGIIFIPLALGFSLTYWCYVATTGPWLRLNRFIYTIGFMAFPLLFRDGLLSLVVFTIVQNLPVFFIWIAHKAAGRKLWTDDLPLAGSPPRQYFVGNER